MSFGLSLFALSWLLFAWTVSLIYITVGLRRGFWSPASRDQSPDTIVNVSFQTTDDRETAELWRAELSAGRLPQRTENVP